MLSEYEDLACRRIENRFPSPDANAAVLPVLGLCSCITDSGVAINSKIGNAAKSILAWCLVSCEYSELISERSSELISIVFSRILNWHCFFPLILALVAFRILETLPRR